MHVYRTIHIKEYEGQKRYEWNGQDGDNIHTFTKKYHINMINSFGKLGLLDPKYGFIGIVGEPGSGGQQFKLRILSHFRKFTSKIIKGNVGDTFTIYSKSSLFFPRV